MRVIGCLFASVALSAAVPLACGVSEVVDISDVPSSFPVGFSLLTAKDRQYVAYYDADRFMTVASRPMDGGAWIYQKLPTRIGWDSHNDVTMALDNAGHLHVSGNMHCVPLVYFRTEIPGDITSLKPSPMTGKLEDRVTYPQFLEDGEGRLVFTYRYGSSGNGINLYNRYDADSRTWARLLDKPLFDGEMERNAYPAGPVRGPDGWFHIHWVWRDTPDCSTNQRLSYARSRDLIHWESAFGQALGLPILYGQDACVVDPIPPGGGIINGGHRMELDSSNQPVLVYHKADAQGNMQIFATRPENGKWKRAALTGWKHPVPFAGCGSMGFIGIRITGLEKTSGNVFAVDYHHKDYGKGTLCFDAASLRVVDVPRKPRPRDPLARKVESGFPGMGIRQAFDSGSNGTDGVRYVLQWETLGPNQDKPRAEPLPPPSKLRLLKVTQTPPPEK